VCLLRSGSRASLLVQSISNVVSAKIALWYSFGVREGNPFARGIVTGLGLTLMSLRQFFEYQRHQLHQSARRAQRQAA
jgi:hypothetical protein